MNILKELRNKIDTCNKELVKVLKKRFEITRRVGELKAKNNLRSYDKNREEQILNKIKSLAKENNLDEIMVEKIFKIIMKQVVKEHKEIKRKIKKN